MGDRGQASVELVAAIPAMLVAGAPLPAAARRRLRADPRRRRRRGRALAVAAGKPAVRRPGPRCRAGRATGFRSTLRVGASGWRCGRPRSCPVSATSWRSLRSRGSGLPDACGALHRDAGGPRRARPRGRTGRGSGPQRLRAGAAGRARVGARRRPATLLAAPEARELEAELRGGRLRRGGGARPPLPAGAARRTRVAGIARGAPRSRAGDRHGGGAGAGPALDRGAGRRRARAAGDCCGPSCRATGRWRRSSSPSSASAASGLGIATQPLGRIAARRAWPASIPAARPRAGSGACSAAC